MIPEGLMILVELPAHLRVLAKVDRQLRVAVNPPITPRAIIDALEQNYPAIQGTLRDPITGDRRALVRFFACEEDRSHDSINAELPQGVVDGVEPFIIIGAIAGG